MWSQKILRNVVPFIGSITAVGGGLLAYFSALVYRNRKEYIEQKENDEQYKDMTRETNEYFGLSWGYKADFLVKEQIDAGDVFFIKYECEECLSLRQMVWCNLTQTIRQEQEYDSIGFAYRDSTGLYIVSNQFGVTKVMEYADFLSQPFLSEFSMRKLQTKNPTTAENRTLFKNLKAFFTEIHQKGEINEEAEEFAWHFVTAFGLNKIIVGGYDNMKVKPFISEYDKSRPNFIDTSRFELDNKLIIRSGTNKQLNSSNLITSTPSNFERK